MDRAPGLGRSFALEGMPLAEARDLGAELEAAKGRVRRDAEFRITCSDLDPRALEAARANAAEAGVAAGIEFRRARAEEAEPEFEDGLPHRQPALRRADRLGRGGRGALPPHGRGRRGASRAGAWASSRTGRTSETSSGASAPSVSKIVNGAEEQWFHWYPPNRAPGGARLGEALTPGGGQGRTGRGPWGRTRSTGLEKSGGAAAGRGAAALPAAGRRRAEEPAPRPPRARRPAPDVRARRG
ncbi:MAG: hypothetical protein MZV49_24040 [Rhodopseudomonas palustris]|nr:hypothetical protein [Rhodopseudomonas palustris]